MLKFLLKWNLLTSPIYFLPFLPIPLVYGIKYIMFLSLFLGSLISTFKIRKVTAQLTLMLIFSFMPALVGDFSESWIVCFHYIAIFSLLGININTIKNLRIKKSDYLLLYTVYSLPLLQFIGILDISGPLEEENIPFFVSGLTFKSTGWSNALAMLIGFILYSQKDRQHVYTMPLILILWISQLISGGRMGFLMSLLILMFFLSKKKYGKLIIVLLTVICLGIFWRMSEEIAILFRIGDTLTSTSSNRYDQYLLFPVIIREMGVFYGHGFGGSMMYFGVLEFHNAFIRTLIDFGMVHFLAVVLFTFYPLRKLWRLLIRGRVDMVHVILLSGILVMLVEPRMIWGNLLPGVIWIYFWRLCVEEIKI